MSNAFMAPRKNKRSEARKAIAQAIIDQYQPTSAEDMQAVIVHDANPNGTDNLTVALCC